MMGDGRRPSTPPLPHGTLPMAHQVGGHAFGKGKTKIGMLVREDGMLLKPCQDKNRGDRELHFYQRVFDPSCCDPDLLSLRPLLPQYHGTWTTPQHPGIVYFCLEDITRKFELPCILDIKVGPITYDPDSSPEKMASEREKYKCKETTGFSVIGIKVLDPITRETYSLTSKELRHYSGDDMLTKALHVFFNKHKHFHPGLVRAFIKRLSPIRDWFQQQRHLHFFASSILFVYDAKVFQSCHNKSEFMRNDKGDAECNGNIVSSLADCRSEMNEEDVFDPYIDLRMIDFTHVFPSDAQDDNYLCGLQGIKDYFCKVLD